ncbi:GHMP kinase [Marine Group I thaumarchaeote]|uniref:Pantoate kinase n=1 Tax=Marine Group I thaumarchaeote TaxID=2511932 RepID=A0A7K4P4F2_9ARCH|nr:MAG: GHMP kinase [Nitrosopumilus sp. YT1]NMI82309.1 GHMP kinase [Candidatus Nitrosopumilus sp. MTA1]NWJ19967.1 GHMP kinase [Marine Group I thaumarchaeote]NWK06836.1 GHMP kinase [Marine Group I thaumarchaeote]NWK13449.1 GHMP kinase [Marine Group I thaumarchaeote]
MKATAFCPAHITGFFKAYLDDNQNSLENFGSTGAGFSIKQGVTTRVKVDTKDNQESNFRITTKGYQPDKTDVSEFVLNEFLKLGKFSNKFFDIEHEISIPVGYGLGSSGAVALSLSFALDQALETKLDKTTIGQIAHNAEVNCKTGLGDVLASFHGGFEIRVKPGAPGIGCVEKIFTNEISVIMICFSPISTNKFIKERLSQINGLGGKMVNRLLESKNYKHFQDMSLEFAKFVNVITPRMQKLVNELSKNNIKCGIAFFGETVFSMIPKEDEDRVLEILQKYSDGIVIKSELDNNGARVLYN